MSSPEREALVDEAVGVFGRLYGRSVTREEARQAMERLVAFFELLEEWDRQKHGEQLASDSRAA